MAFEGGRFAKKLLAADKDVQRYRARMNAVGDAQAAALGASVPPPNNMAGSDDMEVYTNSPVSTEINHNYLPPDNKNQLTAIVAVAAIALVAIILTIVSIRPAVSVTPIPVPAPVPSPAPAPSPSPSPLPTPTPTPNPTPTGGWDVVPTVH
jgi:hypothetical protein